MLLGVAFKQLTSGPLDSEEMHAGRSFAHLDCLDDVRVLYALAVSCFAYKSRDGGFVLAKLFTQDLHCYDAMSGMISAEDSGCSALSDFSAQCVSRQGPTYQVLFGHVPNLTSSGPSLQAASHEMCTAMCSPRADRTPVTVGGLHFLTKV